MVNVKLKKPTAVIFDFSGTAARETFVQKNLMPYFKVAYKAYFDANWEKPECQEDIKALAALAAKDSAAPKIDTTQARQAQTDALGKYVEYCMANKKETAKPYVTYRFHVWFDGYDRNKIQTPVYADVAMHIQKWAGNGIKLFIFSNGWSEATKRFMQKTSHGDLASCIADQYDSTLGSLTAPATYKKLQDKMKIDPKEVVFLTKSPAEGKAAKAAGFQVILVITHSSAVDAASASTKKGFPIARSFTQIEFV